LAQKGELDMPLFNFGLGDILGLGGGTRGPMQAPQTPFKAPPPPPIMDQMSSLLNSAPNTAMGPSGVQTPLAGMAGAAGAAGTGGTGAIDWSKLDFGKIADALGRMGGGNQQMQQRPPMPTLPLAASTTGQAGGGMNPQMLAMLMKLLSARGGMPGGGMPPGGNGGGIY
jgi:hypothetical protein